MPPILFAKLCSENRRKTEEEGHTKYATGCVLQSIVATPKRRTSLTHCKELGVQSMPPIVVAKLC
jgi:hypothetical protein